MTRRRSRAARRAPRGVLRGAPMIRLRAGFIVIAMVLSLFGARLVQLQAVDPNAYAALAASQGSVEVVLPAVRGDIVDRNGVPMAASVAGAMVVADPVQTEPVAPELATFLSRELDIDYVTTLKKLRGTRGGSRFEYVARRVPSTVATDVLSRAADLGFKGLSTRPDPVRDYPAKDVAANLIGFVGTDEALAGLERTFDKRLSGTDGVARFQADSKSNRLPLGENTVQRAEDGHDLTTTIDMDLQWFVQRVLRQTVEDVRGESGTVIVQDVRTGELLAIADYPSYDATAPLDSPEDDLGSRALSDIYEPGSVQKILTAAALIDSGRITPRTPLRVPPELPRQDRVINDWFDHGPLKLTFAGVLAKSSNIGTVLAADQIGALRLRKYLTAFGLGKSVNIGVRGESAGILPAGALLTPQTKDRISFGQSLSVNAVQMTSAISTIANSGVRVPPSLIAGAAETDSGETVGTVTPSRVVSDRAANQTMMMMERVIDPEDGVAPRAAVPGYRVAGKTGTAQRVAPDCGCYDGSYTVSFGGFAPADDPRFAVYVVVQAPGVDGGGGSIGGPAFAKIMGYALRRYRVPPTGAKPSQLPVEWTKR